MFPDQKEMTIVHIAKDASRRFYIVPTDGSETATLWSRSTMDVVSQVWMSNERLAATIDHPMQTTIVDASNGDRIRVSGTVGRGLQLRSDGNLLFTFKKNEAEWLIKLFDRKTERNRTIATAVSGCDDFAVMSDGSLIQWKRDRIYRLVPNDELGAAWKVLGNTADYGIKNIHQIAISKTGRMAIVGD